MAEHDPSISRREAALGVLGVGLFSGVSGTRAQAEAPFDMVLESGIMVPMRDGVRLATDVYRPARGGRPSPGRFPVILERTPYGRNVTSFRDITAKDPRPRTRADVAADYVHAGYVVLFQDCRGRYGSEGEFIKYVNEGPDGFDTCAWIMRQPWSNGALGTIGLSYAAHTQMALACLNPPGLKAMVVDCGGFSNAFQGGIRQGGAFELKQVTWAYNLGLESKEVQADAQRLAALKAVDLKAWFLSMPWKSGHTPISAIPDYEAYVLDQWRHGRFDGYWKRVGLWSQGYYHEFPHAAMIHLSGWYDPYSRTATDNYVGLKTAGRGPLRLIMGPWTHGARSVGYAGDVEFGPQATLDAEAGEDYFAFRVHWFDAHLKPRSGDPTPGEETPVRLFIMGGGSGRKTAQGRLDHGGAWRSERDWPIPDRQETRFYLTAEGVLSQKPPAADAEPWRYVFDPRDPVPTIGGAVTSGEPLMRGGGFDQVASAAIFGARAPYLPLDARPDVLVFQTEPLAEDVEVTGPIRAKLYISSDGPDTDFTIKLLDVYPPNPDYPQGYRLNLTDGILRCRYRASFETPSLMTPGAVYEIEVSAFPTANVFKAGHRIRLDVSSSNFPHFDVNPNTGAPEGEGLVQRNAVNTVFVDAQRPSHVILPLIPRRSAA